MTNNVEILQQIGFNTDSFKNNLSDWAVFFSWSSCDHDNWLIRRNKLKDTDMRLEVLINPGDWKVTFEIKNNLYRLVWKPSGGTVTADLPKYSRLTRWPGLDNFLELPQLIGELEQLSEFKQKQQIFSRRVKMGSSGIDLKCDLNVKVFTEWLGPCAEQLLLPDKDIVDEDDESKSDMDSSDHQYPLAATEPGYPFIDTNLKLSVMDALLSEGLLDLGSKTNFYQFIHREYPNSATSSAEFTQASLDYLGRYPLSSEQLSNIEHIYLDGSCEIYYYLDKYYDGETTQFWISSLDGIEHCPALTEFSSQFSINDLDLAPLTRLNYLKSVTLDECSYQNLHSLLSIQSLQSVSVSVEAINDSLMSDLLARGIKVKRYS